MPMGPPSQPEHENKRFPIGCSVDADPSLMPQDRCETMLGLCQSFPGVGSPAFYKKLVQLNVNFPPSGQISGIFQYTAPAVANDKILVIKNGLLHTCTISANAPQPTPDALNFTSTQLVAVTNSSGTNFTVGKRVRAIQFRTEMIFVQDGGMTPVRYNGTTLFQLGITTPTAPTDGGNIAGVMVVGNVYKYAITYADELGRESSPSTYLTVTMGAGGGRTINWSAPSDAQVGRIYLYRTTGNGTLLYRVVQVGFSIATTTYADTTVTDTLLTLNTGAPLPGQNDPPSSASLIAIYKNRLALNSTADVRVLQLSNLNSPSEFSQLGALFDSNGNLQNATDGITLRILNEFGDEIVGLGHLGSYLGVWNRRTTGIFQGDNPAQYAFQTIHRKGCIASDSICECGNSTVFMAEDGLYALAYETGFSIRKISDDVDSLFRSAAVLFDPPGDWPPTTAFSRADRASAAIGVFMQNRYVLATPPYAVVFDFDTGGISLDYLVGMPYGDGSLSKGYLCMSRIYADREYEVALFSPGIGAASGPVGDMWVNSYYPLQQSDVGIPEPYSAVYFTRGFDGGGMHRARQKQFYSFALFGTCVAPATSGTPIIPQFYGTVSLYLDGALAAGPYPFDMTQEISTQFAGWYWSRDRIQGKLFEQEWPVDARGRVAQVLVQLTANGRLTISDALMLYTNADSWG